MSAVSKDTSTISHRADWQRSCSNLAHFLQHASFRPRSTALTLGFLLDPSFFVLNFVWQSGMDLIDDIELQRFGKSPVGEQGEWINWERREGGREGRADRGREAGEGGTLGRLWVQGATAGHSLSAFGSGSQPNSRQNEPQGEVPKS